ncbi:T9SS type A sorting domain-containing protein [Altibacter sp.]|uniref:T9SS type A sorting domain-containing protein n=1 Tax=Altibacter sp. TaxID=2024823 RepID=UPI00258D2272|nr:T9SS type A sorting domain-containing protein [Altibacter sp.]MCW8981748.1 T9SS type A sorting domain-containing protein [Altibacter sp.]MCW9037337.1 T9SS type A sorting domain-containing protein [Altibacter sp.]
MKKFLLPVLSLLFTITMNAQFTMTDSDSNVITDGTVVAYGVTTFPEASLDFFMTNDSTTDDIFLKCEFVSATNADGSLMELCFGLCYTGLTIGAIYPPGSEVITIAPGATTPAGNHLYNADSGNGTDQIDYVFKFYQVDAGGNEIGTPLTMTYRYDPALGVEDFNTVDVSINATYVSNEMIVTAAEEVQMTVYNLQGKVVLNQNISVGQQTVNVSSLRSQVYLVQFKNAQGATQTTKVIVK